MPINEFWKTSASQFAQIYRRESELIEYELKEDEESRLERESTSSSGKMIPNKVEDAQEHVDAYNSFMVES